MKYVQSTLGDLSARGGIFDETMLQLRGTPDWN